MIHPHTKLQFVADAIGYGVFATHDIPEGTIVYVEDGLEQAIPPEELDRYTPEIREKIKTYSYRDEHGNLVISWDHAKYVNHSCGCNTISTGYGFEMAITDIRKGEQITDEYALFNLDREMPCCCGSDNCREVIRPDDFERLYQQWDHKIRRSLARLREVEQPLHGLLDEQTQKELLQFFEQPEKYKSVLALRYHQRDSNRLCC